jgi:hypothetical protein
MLNVETLFQDPQFDALKRIDKSGRDLVLALVEGLAKQPAPMAPDPLLKQWERLRKDNPTPGDVFVSELLTTLSIAYFQDAAQFAASGVTPIGVQQQAGQFNQYDRGDLWRIGSVDDARRFDNQESSGAGFKVTQAAYSCVLYAKHKDVGQQLMANQTTGDPVTDATRFVIQLLMIIREQVWATNLFATALWGIDRDGVTAAPTGEEFIQFDQAASTPITVFSTDAVRLHEKIGVWPNNLTLSPHVLRELLLHADVRDAFKHTTAGAVPTLQALAAALVAPSVAGASPPSIRIAGGIKTTSAEGAASITTAYIAGKHALLSYLDPSPGLHAQTAWSVFGWQGLLGANAFGIRINDFPIREKATLHRIEGEMGFDAKLVDAAEGVFYESAVA